MPLSKQEYINDDAVLTELKGTAHWATVHKYLELMGADWTDKLINGMGRPAHELAYYQGVLAGLKMAEDIPTSVRTVVKGYTDRS